jgi:glycosyltransferase involved in cell wall biosynthesis
MTPEISVIISTHNPHRGRLQRAIQGLCTQDLPSDRWELIVVDNCSSPPLVRDDLGKECSANTALVREERLGLTFGRRAGICKSQGSILVFVDDDNVLAPDYLTCAVSIFRRLPRLGLGGGKSNPEWDSTAPKPWVKEYFANLALRDLGPEELIAEMSDPPSYPKCAPIGAGMIARREAIESWINDCSGMDVPTGRRGTEFTSGEDCDLVLFVLRDGWEVGYFAELALTHLIPSARLTREYLGRLNHGIARSWVQILARHGIVPWPPASHFSVPFRKIRAYLSCRAWAGPGEYVRWRGACGQFEGRAVIKVLRGNGHMKSLSNYTRERLNLR